MKERTVCRARVVVLRIASRGLEGVAWVSRGSGVAYRRGHKGRLWL